MLIGALTALAETGPGKLSGDHLLGTERSGTRWALAALGTGVATSFLTMALGRRGAPAKPVSAESTEATTDTESQADPTTAGKPLGAAV